MDAGPAGGGGVAEFMLWVTWLEKMYTVDICLYRRLPSVANSIQMAKSSSVTTLAIDIHVFVAKELIL